MTTANRIWILGAADPEMELIELLLSNRGETVVHAIDERGDRVRGGTAYKARAELPEDVRCVYLVECDVPTEGVERVVVDHHRPGDPGYGRSPEDFMAASSIGQTLSQLARWGLVEGVPVRSYADDTEARIPGTEYPRPGEIRAIPQDGSPLVWTIHTPVGWLYIDEELVLAAAADHCLAAAYRGECPGVDPDKLMRWRAESRAHFQRRSVNDVLADIERARQSLRDAPDLVLEVTPGDHCGGRLCDCREGGYGYGGWTSTGTGDCYCDCDGCQRGDYYITARDMRGRYVPELPEASAREGICFVSDGLPDRDGRIKIVCQSGTPKQIVAFEAWAQSQGLVDYYGDPYRGIAGAYKFAAGGTCIVRAP